MRLAPFVRIALPLATVWFAAMPLPGLAGEPLPRFERVVIDANFSGGYQVEIADANGDGRPDVIGVGGGTCAWFENPSWTKRIVTTAKQTPGIISSATADLDGDGRAEIAIAYEFEMNQPKRGKLLLASQGASIDDAWSLTSIDQVGSIHRLRWGKIDADERPDLVVAPIFGVDARPPQFNQDDARLIYYRTGPRPKTDPWKAVLIGKRPVVHAIEVRSIGEANDVVLSASNQGVTLFRHSTNGFTADELVPGASGESPKRGSSEVHLGKLKDGRAFVATINPWHGSQVAVCLSNRSASGTTPLSGPFGPPTILDDTLRDGHALWIADVDGDGDDEVFAGHRGADARVSAFDFNGSGWVRTVLDREIAAQDLRGGDLDGDGIPDVVAIGGATHNVVWYRPRSK